MHDVKATCERCSLKWDAVQNVEGVQQVVDDCLNGQALFLAVCYDLDIHGTVDNRRVHFSFGSAVKLVSNIILHGFQRDCLQDAKPTTACCSIGSGKK